MQQEEKQRHNNVSLAIGLLAFAAIGANYIKKNFTEEAQKTPVAACAKAEAKNCPNAPRLK